MYAHTHICRFSSYKGIFFIGSLSLLTPAHTPQSRRVRSKRRFVSEMKNIPH